MRSGTIATRSPLYGVVRYEEQGGSGGGAYERGADAAVDAGEAAGLEETVGPGLKARFEGVEGEEGEVDGGSG
jgi:hypothetical protein